MPHKGLMTKGVSPMTVEPQQASRVRCRPISRNRSGRAGRHAGASGFSRVRAATIGPRTALPAGSEPAGDRRRAALRLCAGRKALGPVGVILLLSSRSATAGSSPTCRAGMSSRSMAHPFHLADFAGDQAQARHLSQCLAGAAHLEDAAGPGLRAIQFRPQRGLRPARPRHAVSET